MKQKGLEAQQTKKQMLEYAQNKEKNGAAYMIDYNNEKIKYGS
jgi:hypothetical protein